MPGPAPSPTSRRQSGHLAHSWTDLPADGYTGRIPKWPLTTATRRESDHWKRIWRTPQAEAWSRLGWTSDVALYVRWLTEGENGNLEAAKEARMWSDRLGLNPIAMLKNRWRVRADEVAARRVERVEDDPLARLKIVAADAVAGS